MNIVLLTRPSAPYDLKAMTALADGLKKHGLTPQVIEGSGKYFGTPKECDLVVTWGHRPNDWRKLASDYLVIERGYYDDRMKWFSLGYNGLNGEADFVNENSDDSRWKHQHLIKPWKDNTEGYVLIIDQTPGDMSLKSKTEPEINVHEWAINEKRFYESFDIPAKIRSHPNCNKPTQSLKQAFAGARLCVTCSSNTGVEAVMAGVPTSADYPCSMVYKLLKDNSTPDRTQWLRDLSYCQWQLDEIRNGDAWEHLRKKYD